MTSEALKLNILDGSEIYAIAASCISWHLRLSKISTIILHLDHDTLKNIELVVRGMHNVGELRLNMSGFLPSRSRHVAPSMNDWEDWDLKILNFNTRTRTGMLMFPNRPDAEQMIERARHHNGLVN